MNRFLVCLLCCWGWQASAQTALLREEFATDPGQRGWVSFGETKLFRWNVTNQALDVTWDSSRTNSFFGWPLGIILSPVDDFSFSFDLRLSDLRAGSTPGKSNEFEIAVGLINSATATNANAFRGAGQSALYGVRNIVEFDYFPDTGFGDTFATTAISTNNRIFPAHNFPLTLSVGDTYRITIRYTASDQVVHTQATRNGLPYGLPPDNALADLMLAGKPGFRVDMFAISSYSDAIQAGPPAVQGSILAHGTIDNVEIQIPAPPIARLTLRQARPVALVEFGVKTNWSYILERSMNLRDWERIDATNAPPGTATITLQDPHPPPQSAYYRVRAESP